MSQSVLMSLLLQIGSLSVAYPQLTTTNTTPPDLISKFAAFSKFPLVYVNPGISISLKQPIISTSWQKYAASSRPEQPVRIRGYSDCVIQPITTTSVADCFFVQPGGRVWKAADVSQILCPSKVSRRAILLLHQLIPKSRGNKCSLVDSSTQIRLRSQ